MGKIKKILENELVGGTQSTEIYPITSVKAVYNENNERLDNILAKFRGGPLNATNVQEAGFFIVDEELNIGMKVDNDGIHAKNILEYEIINN